MLVVGLIGLAAAAVPVVAGVVKTKKEKEHEEKLGKTQRKILEEQGKQMALAAQIAASEQEAMITAVTYGAAALMIAGVLSLAVYKKAA